MTILVPLLVAIAGALIYALSANPKMSELGRILFSVGALWSIYVFATHSVNLLR